MLAAAHDIDNISGPPQFTRTRVAVLQHRLKTITVNALLHDNSVRPTVVPYFL